MAWDNKGKGPWGNLPPKKEPDLDELLRKSSEKIKQFIPQGNQNQKPFFVLAALVSLVLWVASGIYVVEPEEQGVVLRFGAYHRITDPGLNYHAPVPIESVVKVPVTTINRVEVGTRSQLRDNSGQNTKVIEESLMLTGDENIIDIDFEIQWRVKDAGMFLFNVREPASTVKAVAESSMREVIGRTNIAEALTEGRLKIEQETKTIVQTVLDNYKAGIHIERLQMREVQPPAAVIDAFRDVQTARADRERARNEAETYRNDIIPKARGEAERLIQGAQAYSQQIVAQAQGDAQRFSAVYKEYTKAKEVTKKRIYLETMESILKGMDKILLDTEGSSGVLPYLPVNEIRKNKN